MRDQNYEKAFQDLRDLADRLYDKREERRSQGVEEITLHSLVKVKKNCADFQLESDYFYVSDFVFLYGDETGECLTVVKAFHGFDSPIGILSYAFREDDLHERFELYKSTEDFMAECREFERTEEYEE